MQEGDECQAFRQHLPLFIARSFHPQDDICASIRFHGAVDDPGAGGLILLVSKPGSLPGSLLENHCSSSLTQLPHSGRGKRHPALNDALSEPCVCGNTETHWRVLSGKRELI